MAVTAWINGAAMLTDEVTGTVYGGTPAPYSVLTDGYGHRPYLRLFTSEENAHPGDTSMVAPNYTNIRAQMAGVKGGNPGYLTSTFYYGFSVRIPNPCSYAGAVWGGLPELTPGAYWSGYRVPEQKPITLFELYAGAGVRSPIEFQCYHDLDGGGISGFRLVASGGSGSYYIGDPSWSSGAGSPADNDKVSPPSPGVNYQPWTPSCWIPEDALGGGFVDTRWDTTYLFIVGASLADGWAEAWVWGGAQGWNFSRDGWGGPGWVALGRRVEGLSIGYGGSVEPRMGVCYQADSATGATGDARYDNFEVWLGGGYFGTGLLEVMEAMRTHYGLAGPGAADEVAWPTEYVLGSDYRWLGRAGPETVYPLGGL